MTHQIMPTPDQDDLIFDNTEYFKIDKAAKKLKCTPEDILHMGVVGKISIMAPVMSEGVFQWPVGGDGLGFPEIDEPQKRKFDITDRVFLYKQDLAKIEATGWVIPKRFSSPSKAQEVIDYLQTWMSEPSDQPDDILSTRTVNGEVVESWTVKHLKPWKPPTELMPLREIGLHTPWHAVQAFKKNTKKTTIGHLFISKEQLVRLLSQCAQLSLASAPAKIKSEKHDRDRINPLTLAIKTAQKLCTDPLDHHEVWGVLSEMAKKQEYPLVRIVGTTLYWQREIGIQPTHYEKNSLRMKLSREKVKVANRVNVKTLA
jgi:hypothetical protein